MKILSEKEQEKCVFKQIQNLNKMKLKKLNDKFNVDMFHTKIRGGKAFAGEQKIREFKKNFVEK